jgi:LPS-assembly lipoprotein
MLRGIEEMKNWRAGELKNWGIEELGNFFSSLLPLLISSILLLTACGFEPVYAKREGAVAAELAAVDIHTDSSRKGQLLQAEIKDLLNPRRESQPPEYRLNITTTENISALFIKPDGTASRGDINLVSTYTLVRLSDDKVIDSGNITRISSFNTSENADYATYVAEQDARMRGILELARDYAFRISNVLE